MTKEKRSLAAFERTVLSLVLLAAGVARAQDKTPAQLIELVSLGPSDPVGPRCGTMYADAMRGSAPAQALVELGTAAIPEIERAFDSLEELGNSSPFIFGVGWLADVYAKILGPAAFPRLRRMMSNGRLRGWEGGLEMGISTALGLTSYVDSRSIQGTNVCAAEDPRDGLHGFLLAWEHRNINGLEGRVGPQAQASLKALSKKIPQNKSQPEMALGYRFDTQEAWGKSRAIGSDAVQKIATEVDVPTEFFGVDGKPCGATRVRLTTAKGPLFYSIFVVDNEDLGDLIRLISSCASAVSQH